MPVIGSLDAAFPTVRRYALLIGGLLGVGYETLFAKVQAPALLIVFGGMMGLSELAHSLLKGKGDGDEG